MTIGSRVDATLSRQSVVLENEPLPHNSAEWQAINTLVISSPRLFEDAANIAVTQQYLRGGGRVWVVLDNIDTDLASSLLSENQQLETVETVQLNRFTVETFAQNFSVEDRSVERPESVTMKRVIQHGGKVTHEVDGWPAAIWMKVGRGELLLTTLSSSAWLRRRQTFLNPDPAYQSPFSMQGLATALALQFHSANAAKPTNVTESSYPVDRIGNPVVSRSVVNCCVTRILPLLSCPWGMAFLRWRIELARRTHTVNGSWRFDPLGLGLLMQRRDIPPHGFLSAICATRSGNWREDSRVGCGI